MDDSTRLASIEYEIDRFRKMQSHQWTWEDMLAEIANRSFAVALSEPRPVHRLDIAGPPNTFKGTGSAKVDNFIRDDLGPTIRVRESPYSGEVYDNPKEKKRLALFIAERMGQFLKRLPSRVARFSRGGCGGP
jgi:hypothetical protein